MTALEELRAAMDEVDRELQHLAARRRALSQQIQAVRLRDGGDRHDLDREQQVVASYLEALGPDAAALAEALLRLCRGPLASS
ncbi:MAG TPA: chorismate mutase [Actinomycetota bacterium]